MSTALIVRASRSEQVAAALAVVLSLFVLGHAATENWGPGFFLNALAALALSSVCAIRIPWNLEPGRYHVAAAWTFASLTIFVASVVGCANASGC